MKNKILMVVDYQYDFVSPNGKLYVPEAETIAKEIQTQIDSPVYLGKIFSYDSHPNKLIYEKTEEYKKYGFHIHCEFGKKGWNLFNITTPTQEKFNAYINEYKNTSLFKKEKKVFSMVSFDNDTYFTKDQFDIWQGNRDFESWVIDKFKPESNDIYVVGVATNYCVFMNAMGFAQRGYNVFIIENATKAIRDETETKNKNVLKNRGIKFIMAKDI